MFFRSQGERAGSARIEASAARTLRAPTVRRFLFVAVVVCLAADPGAGQPEPDFRTQEFRSALGQVLHARFDDFAELTTGTAIFQLPEMSCSLRPRGKIASYLCSTPASSRLQAEKLYGNLAAAVTASLPGYPLCHMPAAIGESEVSSFCHYPTILIPDASVRAEKTMVSLEVFGREAGDRGEPAQFLNACALGDLGRHADAVKAWEPILGPGIDKRIYDQERFAYDAAVKATQNCSAEQLCLASDFLAVGNAREASRLQDRIFKSIQSKAEADRLRGWKLDPASAKTVALGDDYDLNARILAAEGKLNSALLSLDSANDALAADERAVARKATYAYHRALILAEDRKYARAAKACRQSLGIDAGASLQERLDQPECVEIDVLASGQPAADASEEPMKTASAEDAVHDSSIEAEIDEAAGTNDYSALPPLVESQGAPQQATDSAEWAIENGSQYGLQVLVSGPSDRRVDLKPGQSASVMLPGGKYKVAAVVLRSSTQLLYGEQTLQAGRRYTSRFASPPN